jgi:hypothetical protein
MSTKSKPSIFQTLFHVGCGLGAVFVICGLLNLWACLVVGLIGSVVLVAFLLGSCVVHAGVRMTVERLAERGQRS